MGRRTSGNMNGERYCGNMRSKEVHDLENEKDNCQINEIIRARNDKPFNDLATARREGYDNCYWCLGSSSR